MLLLYSALVAPVGQMRQMNGGGDKVYRAGKDEEIDVGDDDDDDVGRSVGPVLRVEESGYYGVTNEIDVDATNVNVVYDGGDDGDLAAD